jgi:hypothetical protein
MGFNRVFKGLMNKSSEVFASCLLRSSEKVVYCVSANNTQHMKGMHVWQMYMAESRGKRDAALLVKTVIRSSSMQFHSVNKILASDVLIAKECPCINCQRVQTSNECVKPSYCVHVLCSTVV